MNIALALTEFALALTFFAVAYQRWKMEFLWAASSSFCLGIYFGRIGLLYFGRWLDVETFEIAARPSVVLANALLVLVSMVATVSESQMKGHSHVPHDR